MATPVSTTASEYWNARNSIPGAFWDIDFRMFDVLLSGQHTIGVTGDLLEIGALFGKSAILLGALAGPQETVHVCDVFEQEAGDEANRAENDDSYAGLARSQFEANYRAFVDRDPRVIQELSTAIASRIDPGTLRFVHIDGGHLFETVADDVQNVKQLVGSRGVVVFDDYRALHTPGVAAAVWAEVVGGGLIPFALSEQKMYASWGQVDEYAELLDIWRAANPDIVNHGYQEIAGNPVLIIENPLPPRTLTTRERILRWMPIMPPAVEEFLYPSTPPHRPHLGTPKFRA